MDRLLAQAGSDKTRILMTQIFLKNIAVRSLLCCAARCLLRALTRHAACSGARQDFPKMNEVWDSWVVKGATPPRATVQATLANEKWLIEVVVTAAAAPAAAL